MRYTVYTRDESGILTRTHEPARMSGEQRRADYPHRERLTGWPEASVYWTRETGPATGVAPLS